MKMIKLDRKDRSELDFNQLLNKYSKELETQFKAEDFKS